MIWNALMYLVKTDCQWRILPNDFPKWELVYYYYSKWSNAEDFDLLLAKLRGKVRFKRNQKSDPSLRIMYSQSVRWGNNRSLKGFDGNKEVKGIIIEEVKNKFGYLINVVMRSDEKKQEFKPISKRWIIEWTFSWLDNDRRLCRNYELLIEN